MQLAFFTVPALDPSQSSATLDTFLGHHRVLAIDRRFVDDGAASFWAICVTYQRPQAAVAATTSAGAPRRPTVDYREVLSEDDFAIFAKLRTLRKEIANREKKPAYAVFNNEQLATMVRERVLDKTALAAVDGVGQSRVAKYGDPFLVLLRELLTGATT